jgi:ribonucleoside-diphosphate reductase alpha chain
LSEILDFPEVRKISKTAKNILQKRYYDKNETEWADVVNRSVNFVLKNDTSWRKEATRQMMLNTYSVPNSPCLVNAGKEKIGGLAACFVVDFPDSIEGIFKTKLDFALIARKGGGCGTSLSKIRPEGAVVCGSTHGYAGGPIKFADTICHDAEALSQAGFRNMAIMLSMSVYHPDIIKFITAKTEEGKMSNANISVMVDDKFMQAVENNEKYWTEFNGVKYNEYDAKSIFDMMVEGMWKNGEPGTLFKSRIDDSPYKYAGEEIFSTNPCLTGDMKLLTKDGYKTFSELSEKDVYIIDYHGNSQLGKVFPTGVKEVIELSLSNGSNLKCTPDHFILSTSSVFPIHAKDTLGLFLEQYYIDGSEKYELPRVTNIKLLGKEPVYDFSLPELHWGVVNDLIVHNCSEQPLPINGLCDIMSIDLSKFVKKDKSVDWERLELATQLTIRFLDSVLDVTAYPTKEIEQWSKDNRAIAGGIMGFADYCLMREIAYGSQESLDELGNLLGFISKIAEYESIQMGKELGVPIMCQNLPIPRRNITLTTIAPTGTVSLIAGCSSGLEPIFSEVTIRNDKTGTYTFENDLVSKPYFRCAVSANGAQEVTWEEHINVLSTAQKYIDSGVSKTVNFPNHTRRETIAKAVMKAWKQNCKGLAVYRNGSRKDEVLSPKNMKKDKCPKCGSDIIEVEGKKRCVSCKQLFEEKSPTYYD